MSEDAPSTAGIQPSSDETSAVDPLPSAQSDDPLARFDAAIQPFLGRLGIGIVSEHHLAAALTAVRNAVAAMIGPPQPPPSGESLDVLGDQRRAARAAQVADEPSPSDVLGATPESDAPPAPGVFDAPSQPPSEPEEPPPPAEPKPVVEEPPPYTVEPAQPPADAFQGVTPPTTTA